MVATETTYTMILDRRPKYMEADGEAGSLLLSPLGERSLLHFLATQLAENLGSDLFIVPCFESNSTYERSIREVCPIPVCIISANEFQKRMCDAEPCDSLIVADSLCLAVDGLPVEQILKSHGDFRGVSHAVAVGSDPERTREHVECDDRGLVRRIQRLYDRVSWPEAASTAVLLSVMPARTLSGLRFSSLPHLRELLAANGVLGKDLPVNSDVVDMAKEQGMLAANERLLTQAARRKPQRSSASTRRNGAVIAAGAKLHPTVRLSGPVLVQADAVLGKNATVIGPAVIGAGSRIGNDATIAQSIVVGGASVDDGVTIHRRVVCGHCTSSSSETNADTSLQSPTTYPGGEFQRREGDLVRSIDGLPRWRGLHLALKRATDIVVSLVGLAALSLLMVVVAILIKLESRGSILFRHRRERMGGADFSCLKYRTMIDGAHRQQRELYEVNELDGPQFKLRNDPRTTRLGRLLRVTNIDEVPQLINVLMGQMSIVGPRPSPFRENQICIPWRRARLSVRPGITGLWQICRDKRCDTDFNQWIFYDITYVRQLSIWLDFKIILATVLTLGGRWSVPLGWLVRDAGGNPAEPRPYLTA